MQRVNRATAVPTMPAPPAGGAPGYFTGGNPGLSQPASVPGYEWFNGVQEELIGMILRGGISPSDGDVAQVRKSLDRLFGGGLASFSANTTLTVDNAGLVLVNASGGARTITLPAANALGGRPIRFQIEKTDSSANTVTIQRAGADTIEGGTSVVLSGQWASVALVSDGGTAWMALTGVLPGQITSSGLTMATGRLLGRISAGIGVIQEILIGNPAPALSLGVNLGTVQNTTSGVARDFTGIPAGVREITVMLDGVSTNGSSIYLIQLGDSGGVETTGYNCVSDQGIDPGSGNLDVSSAGFGIRCTTANASVSGAATLSLLDPATNTWAIQGLFSEPVNTRTARVSGTKSLSAELDRIRLTATNGTDTFDAGKINISWRF